MLSNLLELLGLAAITAGAYVVGGLAAALFVGGPALMFVGVATDDAAIARLLRAAGGRVGAGMSNARAGVKARRRAKAERLNAALRTILRAVDRSG